MGTKKLTLAIIKQLFEILKCTLLILISIALSTIFLPILLFFLLLNQFGRLIVSVLLYFQNDGTRLISEGVDGIWTYKKPGNSRNILIVYIYTNNINLEKFRQNYFTQIIQNPAYTKLSKILIQKFGYYCWKDTLHTTFDIKQHIKYVTEEPTTESGLKTILNTLAVDMDENKPQWEELIVPYFKYDKDETYGKCARIYRSHHAYMDGGSTLIMSGNCMYSGPSDSDSDSSSGLENKTTTTQFPYMVNPLRRPKSSPLWKEFIFKAYCGLTFMTTVFKILYESNQIQSRFLLNEYSGKLKFSWSKSIKLNHLKEIKDCTRTSLPTVLSSIVGQSLAKLADSIETTHQQQAHVDIGLVGALLPYPNIKPQNRFTVVNFNVPTSSLLTKLENLQCTQSKMNQLINSPNGYINYLLFKFFGSCPAFIIQFMMNQAGTPVIYSNTPWASEKVKLWGETVEDVIGWMPLLTTAGIGILTVSYNDSLKFCVISDENCLSNKELDYLTEELSSQVEQLMEEARALKKEKDFCMGALLV